MNEILSLRLALEEAQAQLPTQALIHPKEANTPPIVEPPPIVKPIPAQLTEHQEDGLAINIDEFIVEPQIPDWMLKRTSSIFRWERILAIMIFSTRT